MSENKNKAEQTLAAYLRENERVFWYGKNEPFPLLDKNVKNQILGKWICAAVVAVGLIAMYLSVAEAAVRDMKIVAGIAVIAAFIMLQPVLERHKLLRQKYWLTNQRAIMMKSDGTLHSMELADIDEIQLVKGMDSYDCVAMGCGAIKDLAKNLRWRACNPKTERETTEEGEEKDNRGIIFYAVSNAEAAMALLEKEKVR